MSRAMVLAVAVSIAVHGVAGYYVYTMNFKPMALPVVEQTPPMVFQHFPILLDQKQPRPQPKVNNPLRPHAPTQTTFLDNSEQLPFAPVDKGPAAGDAPPTAGEAAIPEPPQPPQTPAKTIAQPRWIAMPNASQLEGAYPRRALMAGQTGSALLSCTVNAVGTVSGCTVVRETPAGLGFGAAAVKLSRYFRMQPKTEDGQPVDGAQVSIPLKFTLGD